MTWCHSTARLQLQVHSFFNMRAPLLPLTRRAVFSPIETIVCFAIIGTLAYFQVLSAIKHSVFFAPTFPSTLRTAHALLRDGQWVGVDADWYGRHKADPNSRAVELQQVIFSSQSVAVQSNDAASSVIRSYIQGILISHRLPRTGILHNLRHLSTI